MGCSSSRTIEKTNHSKTANSSGNFEKEKKTEAIFISKKLSNAYEIQDKIINLIEKNEKQLVKNKHEKLENDKANLNSNAHPSAVNSDLNLDNPVLKIDANLGEKRDLAFDGNKNLGKFNTSNANNKSDLSNFNNAELNRNNSKKSGKNVTSINHNYNASRDKKISDNLALTANNNNSKGFQNKENNLNTIELLKEDCGESEKLKPQRETVLKEQFDKEENKNINCEIKINQNNLNNNRENDSAISKLSSNLIKSKAQILKDTNTAKDENELILNLTKTQNLTHFQDDNQTKNLLNSIDKDDNLIIKFNTGPVANSLLNNTNFKINESQSQQNISNIHNNPSICEENKSDRLSFKFDLTSNFDLHSRFSKFDSTNNISRIKVPYYENHNNNNNNYEQNYLLTNVSHMNDLNNLTNLNNNFNSNTNNNNQSNNNGNYKGLRNQPVNSQAQEKDLQSSGKKVHKESNENMDEEEIQLSITISVRASKFEAMYPIWIEKNREVEFKVIGKWTIDNTFPMCDCNGYQIKNKKEAFSNNNNTNANTNNNSIVTISNYNTASTNNTNVNININSKNINVNSNNLVLLNSPTTNKVKNMQEEMNRGFNAVEVDKKSSNAISALLATPESDNNANVNVHIENTNINKNEIKIGYIGPSTIIVNDNNNIKSEFNRPEKNNDQPKSNCANYDQPNNIDDTSNNKNSNKIETCNNNNQNNLNANYKNNSSNKNPNNATNNNNSLNCLLENYPNGCLIGRVLGGPYFRISSKCTYISEHSGPLFLKMNIHDLRLNPEGKLSVFINGADDLPFMSIEKKLGWDINSFSLGCQLLKTESERLIYTFINKIRINSNLFAQQYLENIKSLSNATNNLYLCFFKNAKTFKLLNMDGKLIEYGKRLLKREIERLYNLSTAGNLINNGFNNNNNNLINSNNPSAKNRQEILESENKQILEYEKNLSLNGYSNLKYFIKKHEDTKPLSVAIKLIIDEKARQEILSKNNNSVGLVTIKLPQAQKGFYTCLVFGNLNSEQNLITEINRNEREIMITE